MVTGLQAAGPRDLGSISREGTRDFLFSKLSKPVLGPTQNSIHRLLGTVSRGGTCPAVKLITGYDLVPRLKMSGALLPFTHTVSCRVQIELHLYGTISRNG
jgi:hypothetical protein